MRHNKSSLWGGAAMALLVGGAACAQDTGAYAPTKGPYVGLAGGGQWLNDVTSTAGSGTASFNGGFVALGKFGWGLGNGFRAELEGGYRRSDVNSVSGSSTTVGGISRYTVMVNGPYDFDPATFGMANSALIPHLGAGVGSGVHSRSSAGFFNGNTASGQFDFFGMQAIVRVRLCDYPAGQVQYRLPLSHDDGKQGFVIVVG